MKKISLIIGVMIISLCSNCQVNLKTRQLDTMNTCIRKTAFESSIVIKSINKPIEVITLNNELEKVFNNFMHVYFWVYSSFIILALLLNSSKDKKIKITFMDVISLTFWILSFKY